LQKLGNDYGKGNLYSGCINLKIDRRLWSLKKIIRGERKKSEQITGGTQSRSSYFVRRI